MLAAGTRLGPYEIVSALGAGGMGEVYKARDTRLDRIVAVKVLPSLLADDAQFRERFDREAKAISALDHPNICTLYDVGVQDGTSYLVMQYLDGETLSARLQKGAVPLNQALQIAMQIAEALDKAHRAGIVHRDLKPANIMLAKAGAMLLDFGLAKASTPAGSAAGLSMLPTTPANLTAQGTILGTFQYMAPEQLEGQEADDRTDIFAFGSVVYEMLTAKKAFEGRSHASLISSIMSSTPPAISAVQPVAPAALDRLVQTCLAKNRDDRFQSAHDVLLQLRWIADAGPASAPARSPSRVAWMIAAVASVAAIGMAAMLLIRRAPASQAPEESSEFAILAPEKGSFVSSGIRAPMFAISRDGRQLVFVAAEAGTSPRLWLRSLISATPRPLSGTEYATGPFWSPDGRSVGYFARGKLKTLDLGSGASQVIADAGLPAGGTWNQDGVILFTPDLLHGVLRVSAGGGPATPATRPTQPFGVHALPSFLPDGRHFLFVAFSQPVAGRVYVGSLDSSDTKPLVESTGAIYAPPGYLLYARQPKLIAQPFDAARLTTTGEAVAIADVGSDARLFDASSTGTLIHGLGIGAQSEVAWVDRAGRTTGIAAPLGFYDNIALSPDETRIAFDRATTSNDVWLMDLQRRIVSRFTFRPPNNNVTVWSPDGATIAFASMSQNPPKGGEGALDIYQRRSNMSAADEVLLKLDAPPIMFPSDWSSDGRFLTYYRMDPRTQLDEWVLPLSGEKKPLALLHSEFNESQGQFSPDVKWIAYVSDESGSPEVYVQSFPTLTERRQVSSGGGTQPRWNRSGKELFYLATDGRLMVVAVKPGATFDFDAPRELFRTTLNVIASRQTYSVSRDGQRFLLMRPTESASVPLSVVLNWPALLKK